MDQDRGREEQELRKCCRGGYCGAPAKPARVRIGHADIDNLTMDEAIVHIEHLIRLGKPTYVVTPNVDHVVQLERDERLRRVYDGAALILCDGMPLLWAAHYLKTPIKERVAGSDLFPRLCEFAAHKGYRVFFLGGRAGAGEKAIKIFSARHPGFDAQCYCPPMGFEKDQAENAKIIQMIHDYRPQILCVALGAPKQEYWMHDHITEIAVPVSIGVGASLDFVAGYQKRAPVLVRKIGLEWSWRLMQEPRRMYRRYLVDDTSFLLIVRKQKKLVRRG